MSEPTPLERALKLLATSERTAAEVSARLSKAGVPEDEVRDVVERLRSMGYLDDAQVAERTVERKRRSRPLGRERIRADLQRRGIDETVAEQALHDDGRELDRALEALTTRFDSKDRIDRGARFLANRGFDEDTIREAIERFFDAELDF